MGAWDLDGTPADHPRSRGETHPLLPASPTVSPRGWTVPLPREPSKGPEELARERAEKVEELAARGLLRSAPIRRALLGVPREEFVPRPYRDYAYREVPLPLPGRRATISCPHSYPLFYEPLGLAPGHRFLEVGSGSGYGVAVAREVVGNEGLVVSVEIDPETHRFARANLERLGYADVLVVLGDGARGHPEAAPYDRIAVTAAAPEVPPALFEQLAEGGKLIAPIEAEGRQMLTLFERGEEGIRARALVEVLYVPLRSG